MTTTPNDADRQASKPIALFVAIGELTYEKLHEAFARHRLASIAPYVEALKEAREALYVPSMRMAAAAKIDNLLAGEAK